MLTSNTTLVLGMLFRQEPFNVPGPHTGLALLQHHKGIQEAVRRYKALNGGKADAFTAEMDVYLDCLQRVCDGVLVLSSLPIARLAEIISDAEKKAGKKE